MSEYITAVIAAEPCIQQCVLQKMITLNGATTNNDVVRLHEARVSFLTKATEGGKPAFSWCQKPAFVGSSTDADGNNNPSEHEAQQFDGSSIPCVFETPKTSGQKKFRIKTLKPNFSQRLDKIGEEIEGGGTEESEQENSGETKEKQYVFEK